MQNEVDDTSVFIYLADNKVYFLASSIISNGLLIVKNEKGKTILQKVITDTNQGFLTIARKLKSKLKKVTICIISTEINYEKKLNL